MVLSFTVLLPIIYLISNPQTLGRKVFLSTLLPQYNHWDSFIECSKTLFILPGWTVSVVPFDNQIILYARRVPIPIESKLKKRFLYKHIVSYYRNKNFTLDLIFPIESRVKYSLLFIDDKTKKKGSLYPTSVNSFIYLVYEKKKLHTRRSNNGPFCELPPDHICERCLWVPFNRPVTAITSPGGGRNDVVHGFSTVSLRVLTLMSPYFQLNFPVQISCVEQI